MAPSLLPSPPGSQPMQQATIMSHLPAPIIRSLTTPLVQLSPSIRQRDNQIQPKQHLSTSRLSSANRSATLRPAMSRYPVQQIQRPAPSPAAAQLTMLPSPA